MSFESTSDISLRTKKCIIVSIDILGAQEWIKRDEAKSLHEINEIYIFTKEALAIRGRTAPCNIRVKIFSDNILAYIEMNDDYAESVLQVDDMLHFVALFQLATHIIANKSVRGGITIGNLYEGKIDEINTYVWGTGLVRAYELESSIAIYPRVIIDPSNLELITISDHVSGYNIGKVSSVKAIPTIIDSDGIRYVSYEEAQHPKNPVLFIYRTAVSLKIQKQEILNKNSTNTKIMQKLNWSIQYHNKICNKYNLKNFCLKPLPLSE